MLLLPHEATAAFHCSSSSAGWCPWLIPSYLCLKGTGGWYSTTAGWGGRGVALPRVCELLPPPASRPHCGGGGSVGKGFMASPGNFRRGQFVRLGRVTVRIAMRIAVRRCLALEAATGHLVLVLTFMFSSVFYPPPKGETGQKTLSLLTAGSIIGVGCDGSSPRLVLLSRPVLGRTVLRRCLDCGSCSPFLRGAMWG